MRIHQRWLNNTRTVVVRRRQRVMLVGRKTSDALGHGTWLAVVCVWDHALTRNHSMTDGKQGSLETSRLRHEVCVRRLVIMPYAFRLLHANMVAVVGQAVGKRCLIRPCGILNEITSVVVLEAQMYHVL